MTVPLATYRLQFRDGMTFDRAIELVPHLQRIGISHLYASPIYTATTGSTHGYDVTDQNEIDPVIGGREGFDRLSAALQQAGLGLLLDIVPNHMAASPENAWWRSVLEWGAASPFAGHFDIDWSERLTLPFLGRPFSEALEAGELGLAVDPERNELAFTYFDLRLPLAPSSYALALAGLERPAANEIAALTRSAAPANAEVMHARIGALLQDAGDLATIEDQLARASHDRDLMERVHAAQPWRLTFWKEAREHLSYRRFFEVTGLVGVRVEDERVFDDVHRLTLDLVRSGQVDGLRIDHVDGLADPKAYLERLRVAVGPDLFIVVEKILTGDEAFPADWPVAGTTGYEFLSAIADLQVDAATTAELDRVYAATIGRAPDLRVEQRAAKTLILTRNFAGELERLVERAGALAASSPTPCSADSLRQALVELIVAFPVYRTYGDRNGLAERDGALLDAVVAEARGLLDEASATALDFVAALITANPPGMDPERVWDFRCRFQQLSGPVMAKAVEDTLFYRYNRLIALNEVGGEPEQSSRSALRFHERMAERLRSQPHGLLATATHDTKRGEDARARLAAISEAPGLWGEAVARWRDLHKGHIRQLPDGPAPGPDFEWLLYQALAGLWPPDLDPRDADALAGLRERLVAFIEKAAREAKRRTDWLEPDEAYEEAVKAYAAALLSPDNSRFLGDFVRTLSPFIRAGAVNSLAQMLLKLAAPGVPDIYQGTGDWDLSLVDPDNRRAVDFAALMKSFDEAALPKQRLLEKCLLFRREHPALFNDGDYLPLPVTGPLRRHVVAFARRHGEAAAIAVAPRLTFGLLGPAGDLIADRWAGTAVELPAELAGRRWSNIIDNSSLELTTRLDIATVLGTHPVAFLASLRPPLS